MEWLRTHPYASALCGAGLLIVVGVFIVERRATQPIETSPTAWGGGTASLLNPTSYPIGDNTSNGAGGPRDEQTIMEQVKSGPPYTYIPPKQTATSAHVESDSYDFDTFVAMLTQGRAPTKQSTEEGSSLMDAYAYIPRGLISTTTPKNTRTDLQQKLYDYGNDIGGSIESFEQQHANTVQILKEQVEDRSDLGKAQAVVDIGRAFQNLGNSLAAMDNVPSGAGSAHQALAQGYVELGKNLTLVPQAERDSDFIQAIQAYNASADSFTKSYIRLVSLFGAYGVVFTSNDSGRVFTFSPSGF